MGNRLENNIEIHNKPEKKPFNQEMKNEEAQVESPQTLIKQEENQNAAEEVKQEEKNWKKENYI